ncbi:MAG: hypothetical protein CME40_13695 [Haliea sp.]|nr:hypothetical protein [Haliea sp.]|tara:strand:- start:52870 stop:54114 length:1245 start_codon:yes stop_codon:yes gene_type:complete
MSQSAADFLIAARQSEIRTLQHLLPRVRLVVIVSGLVHALQRERGASGIFTGSRGQRFRQQRRNLVSATDQQVLAFDQLLADLERDEALQQAGSHLLSRLARVLHQLGRRDAILRGTARLEMDEDRIYDFYTGLIQDLLGVVFDIADTATDSAVTRALVALLHFMQGKELAGQERALGALRLTSGRLCAQRSEKLVVLQEGQRRSLEVFSRFADAGSLAVWQSWLADVSSQQALDDLRAHVVARQSESSSDADLSETWFAVCTARIDAMKAVEDQLSLHLRHAAEESLAASRREFAACHREVHALAQLDRLSEQPEAALVGDGEALRPGMRRSLIDLLEEQTSRLADLQEALEQARTALAERRLVDRAKALLIRHRGLSEHEAHSLLRRMAMNQGCKLPEVARAVLNLSEVFDG